MKIETTYKGIYYSRICGKYKWRVRIKNEKGRWVMHGSYIEERDAAIAYDKYLLSQGKQPVNILKPINNNGSQINKA